MALDTSEPVGVIATRVREVRNRHGWTAQDLADRLTEIGLPWNRTTVVKLENGKRENVTVNELLALSLALNVAPVNLLVSLSDAPYKITPLRTENADTVRAWVRGEMCLPGAEDARTYFAEVSERDMRVRIDAVRAQYDLGPHEDQSEWGKFRREGTRMRQQNADIAEWEKREVGDDGEGD
ncbi:helix-turn-helix transcriptional regulator [Streptomyces sp. NPDC059631]|uniref:helix-turn-helix transcriptional regulator n=1 Tax=Streptomyces sp. NPDC059631 TaxID=3346890 RepID=UPI0036C5901B